MVWLVGDAITPKAIAIAFKAAFSALVLTSQVVLFSAISPF